MPFEYVDLAVVLLVVTPGENCGVVLDLAEGRDREPTTIRVEWNGLTAEAAIEP